MFSVKRRVAVSVLVMLIASSAVGAGSNDLWTKFETLRKGSNVLHQEFEVTRHFKTPYRQQETHFQITVDIGQGRWREQSIGGFDDRIRLFDGQDLLVFESGGKEYVRTKAREDTNAGFPQPYGARLNWNKLKELQRLPCGFSGKDSTCVIVEAPLDGWLHPGPTGAMTRMTGINRMMIDTETGIWLQSQAAEQFETPTSTNQMDVTYQVKKMHYRASEDADLFKLPDGMNEVKNLTPWDADRMKKQLVGKSAPDLQLTDIHGKPVSLAELKGKTILLDFWTTWCPPCQADAPSIDKLNQKYGDKNLAIIGISVNEDREVVEKYLKKHPHGYPVALSSENQMPRPYQIGVFPTYLIIDGNGALVTAEEGDKGFGKLRKDLQKAGLEVE